MQTMLVALDRFVLRVVNCIDILNEKTGAGARWACVALVAVLGFEVIARYAFRAPTFWAYETASMIGVFIASLGWAYTQLKKGHVRVDVIYVRLSLKQQALLDVVGFLLFFFPFVVVLLLGAISQMNFAWKMNERIGGGIWEPPAGPVRTLVVVGVSLFLLQGVADFVRILRSLRNGSSIRV